MTTPRESIERLAEELTPFGPSLGLREEPLPAGMAWREGAWNGRRVVLRTRSFRDDGGRALRIARVEGEAMSSLTLVGIAGDLVLGVDVVAFADRFATVILDVCSAPPTVSDRLVDATRSLRTDGPPSLPPGAPFGPAVLWARPPGEKARDVADAVLAYAEAFREGADARVRDADASARIAVYLSWLAASKKQMKALSALFGAEWVPRYFDDVFLAMPPDGSRIAARGVG